MMTAVPNFAPALPEILLVLAGLTVRGDAVIDPLRSPESHAAPCPHGSSVSLIQTTV
jgi:hypothetical protein